MPELDQGEAFQRRPVVVPHAAAPGGRGDQAAVLAVVAVCVLGLLGVLLAPAAGVAAAQVLKAGGRG
ncbi:hypothetical protein [Kitasatospora sp. NPDC087314]|uniref:hypothetical protein n=1 Tax=Kitasatospora sp. NPDC087314 TaxID=3364068 RepID=UPI0037F3E6E0